MEPESHRDRRLLSALPKRTLYRIGLREGGAVSMGMAHAEMVDALCAARAERRSRKSKRIALNDGPNDPSTESTQSAGSPLRRALGSRLSYEPWGEEEVRTLRGHPDMSAAELAAIMGRTPKSVRSARSRYGRYGTGTDGLCVRCDQEPVYATSRTAKALHLCERCYQDWCREHEGMSSEAAAIRQARKRRRDRGGR